jgi:hypothetical protein
VTPVREIRALARRLDAEKFRAQLGPFALIQRPAEGFPIGTDSLGLPLNVAATATVKPENISMNSLSLLFEFEELMVSTLPPLGTNDELTVGRQPDCDVVVEHSSVSKRHATFRWDEAEKRCTLTDLGSTNGTFLNASIRVSTEAHLKDGDIISFGDVQFWFLLADTLYRKLSSSGEWHKLGARSG